LRTSLLSGGRTSRPSSAPWDWYLCVWRKWSRKLENKLTFTSMDYVNTSESTKQISLEAFHEVSVEVLEIPENERKLYRHFVEEKQYMIKHLWSSFLAEEASRTKDDWAPAMWIRIDETPLSFRVKNIMRCYDIILVGHLVQLSRRDLLKFRSLGPCTLHEITKYLATLGLKLASD